MSGYTLRGTVVNPVRAYIQLPGGNRRRQGIVRRPEKVSLRKGLQPRRQPDLPGLHRYPSSGVPELSIIIHI